MNELKEIKDLFAEPPPPTDTVIAQARARLTAAGSRPRRPRWAIAVTAAAAVLALSAIIPWSASTPAGHSAVQLSGRDILLVAAEHAETDTSAGKYWQVRILYSDPTVQVGSATDPYHIEARAIAEQWIPQDPSQPSWYATRVLAARPVTEADREAWRRAGSPATWDTGKGPWGEADAGVLRSMPPGAATNVGSLTRQQLQDLPSDVTALRRALEPAVRPDQRGSGDGWLINPAMQLLRAPVSGQVRGAAFRLLAELGATNTGPTTDPMGREGVGVEVEAGHSWSARLVIDPTSGTLLGQVNNDGVSVVTLLADWTDDAPAIPSSDIPGPR